MERRAKERLIGASILVALLVLVVPELLSGPKPAAPPRPDLLPAQSASAAEPVRTVTVDLATSKPASPEVFDPPPAASEAPTSGAASAPQDAAPAVDSTPAPPPKSVPSATVSAPKPVESSAPSPTSRGEWAVQLGSFANRGNAEALVRQLKVKGFQVYDSASGSGQSARYRVRVGPLSDRAAAERALAKLKSAGHPGALVSPGSR
jgi:DedD protein